VLPGLVNLHTHTTMTALRGLIDDVPAPAWLPRAQELESRLSLEDRYWSSLAGACELLRAGVTCVADRGAGMSRCAQALWDSGIRAVVAHTLSDAGGESGWRESEAVLDEWGVTGARRIFAGLGPHATDTCGDRLLARVRDRAGELGALTFIHVAQSRDEVAAAKKRGDAGCVHLLHRLGLLAPTLVAAHCTYLEPGEVELLASTGTRVAHCPVANAKLEGAVAGGWRFWRDGIAVGLGTDSAASNNAMDPWFDLKFAALFHKTAAANPEALPARTAVEWFTRTAAACLGMADQIGSLRPGARADIIALRTDVPHAVPLPDPWSHLAYSAAGSDVDLVVVDGSPVMRSGSFQHIDHERIIHELGRIRAKLLA
jgi:5-methylthioadenosine/S-adenosylhomocysteine deaminase